MKAQQPEDIFEKPELVEEPPFEITEPAPDSQQYDNGSGDSTSERPAESKRIEE